MSEPQHLIEEQDDRELQLPQDQRSRFKLTLEPVMFMLLFAINFSSSIYINNLVYQICVYDLGQDRDTCRKLGTENESDLIVELETAAEKYSTDIIMVSSICQNVFPALCSFFLGLWSDRFGRKPILILSISGIMLSYVINALIVFISMAHNVNPWWYTLSAFPQMVTGGYCALITVLYCYLTDITEENNRGSKMISLQVSFNTGLLLGSLACTQVLNYMNAFWVFAICSSMSALTLTYVIVFIPESVRTQPFTGSKLRELFRINHLFDMIEAFTRRRVYNCRLIIWLLIICMSFSMFAIEGSITVMFLFVREKFGWTVREYGFYESTGILLQVVGTLLGLFILKKLLKISEAMLAVIAAASYVMDGVTKGVATEPIHLYLAIILSMFKSIFAPMARSVISFIVPNDEIGKLFAITTSLESLSPLISTPLYSKLYQHTITTMPGAFNFLNASIYFATTLILLVVYVLLQRMPQVTYSSITE